MTLRSVDGGESGIAGRILVVDDDEGVRSTAAEILRGEGYDVIEAEDGQVALDLLARYDDVTLMLLDIRMPRLDGIGVLDALDQPPKVVLVSAFTVDGDTRSRIDAKVFRYLSKPVLPDRLLSTVAEAAAAS